MGKKLRCREFKIPGIVSSSAEIEVLLQESVLLVVHISTCEDILPDALSTLGRAGVLYITINEKLDAQRDQLTT